MAKQRTGRTRRNQYDEFLIPTYKKTCRDVTVLGFQFEDTSRQHQFHYALMEHAIDSYLFYDGSECRAHIICENASADELRKIATNFDGEEFRVFLDESI